MDGKIRYLARVIMCLQDTFAFHPRVMEPLYLSVPGESIVVVGFSWWQEARPHCGGRGT